MADRSVSAFAVIALLGLLVGGCASDGTMGSSDTSSTSGASGASGTGSASAGGTTPEKTKTMNVDRVASGSVEDTLDACMARIPKDATAGQKMLADQSCSRDQAGRR